MNLVKLISAKFMGRHFISIVEKPTVKLRRSADDLQEVFPKIKNLAPQIQKLAAEINTFQSTLKGSKIKKAKLAPVGKLHGKKINQINAKLAQFASLTKQCRALFEREIRALRGMTLDYLTLVVREYDQVKKMRGKVYKIKVPERDRMRLDAIRAETVHHLSQILEHINEVVHKDWLAAKFHERRATSNVIQMMHEVDLQGTIVKLRRIRQLTIEIDNLLRELGSTKVTPETLPKIIELFEKELHDLKQMSHHTHVITRRFHNQIIQIRGKGKRTTEKEYRGFLTFTRKQAARAYWDTRKPKIVPVAKKGVPKAAMKPGRPVLSSERRAQLVARRKQQEALREAAAYRKQKERKKEVA